MKMAPTADVFHPDLDFIVGGDLRLWERLRLFSVLYRGGHIGKPKVTALQGQSLQAESPSGAPLIVDMDGDLVGGTPLSARAIPAAIRVCC